LPLCAGQASSSNMDLSIVLGVQGGAKRCREVQGGAGRCRGGAEEVQRRCKEEQKECRRVK